MARHPIKLSQTGLTSNKAEPIRRAKVNTDPRYIKIKSFIEEAIIAGITNKRILEMVNKEYGRISKFTFDGIMEQISIEWSKEAEQRRSLNKEAAERRLMKYIRTCSDKQKWSDVSKFENLLADIQGTKDPITINVNMAITSAMYNVIGGMTAEQLQSSLNQVRELERKAKIIDVSGFSETERQTGHLTSSEALPDEEEDS